MKNLALMGAMPLIIAGGPGSFSVDAKAGLRTSSSGDTDET